MGWKGGRPRILVAEDDVDLRVAMAELLRDDGHEVLEAPNGAIALEQALLQRPEIAVVDYSMPVADGRELVASLRSLLRPPPAIIAISAFTSAARWAAENAFAVYLTKPFSLPSFLAAVAHVESLHPSLPTPYDELRLPHCACVLAIGEAAVELSAVLPSALRFARVVVVDSVEEAMYILAELAPELVVIADVSEHDRVRSYLRLRDVPCLVRSREGPLLDDEPKHGD